MPTILLVAKIIGSAVSPHVVGDLSLLYEALELVADPGLTIVAYTAQPGSPSQEGSGFWPAGPPRHASSETPTTHISMTENVPSAGQTGCARHRRPIARRTCGEPPSPKRARRCWKRG
jgi:hypothetical protein